ncbi:MAG TPA: ATP-binding cassette domain-containing protein [Marmoricola sp.]|jgi:branched-chain amino acid transport system ATP-binding protein|nr:ATP-binding cassette domain-containing protein [Marmoricola sp.]
MIELIDLSAGYLPGVTVVDGFAATVPEGTAVGVIGRNGAGKTCLAMGATGLLPHCSGSVRIDGAEVGTASPARRVRAGLSLVPEGRLVFGQLSVTENLRVAAYGAGRRLGKSEQREVVDLFPVLGRKADHRAASMSGGEQQMLAIARALVQRPRVIVLDEPSLGLAPVAVDVLVEALRRVMESGVSLLLCEQNPHLLEALCSEVLMMDSGRVVRHVEPHRLRDADVVRDYLGTA